MAAFEYKAPDGSVMKVDVGVWGQHDVTVQLRSLTKKLTVQELLAIAYPTFDAEEQALHPNAQ